jgi:hypothetical protein
MHVVLRVALAGVEFLVEFRTGEDGQNKMQLTEKEINYDAIILTMERKIE